MSSFFINGAKYAVSSALAAAVTVTALSNADPAVASTTTPAAVGTVGILTSGWEELNEAPVRISAIAAGVSMTLEGVDTTNTVRFPAGEGIGTFEAVSGWTSITQITDIQQTGGEQNYETYQYVGDAGRRQRKKPTYKNAMDVEFVMDYDPDLSWYDKLVDLDYLAEPVIIRETLTTGDVLYYAGTIAFNKVPTKQMNKNMQVRASLSMSADPIRFAS
jgi:hypothetical protein